MTFSDDSTSDVYLFGSESSYFTKRVSEGLSVTLVRKGYVLGIPKMAQGD